MQVNPKALSTYLLNGFEQVGDLDETAREQDAAVIMVHHFDY